MFVINLGAHSKETICMRNKYLIWSSYSRKVRILAAKMLLRFGIPLLNTKKFDGFFIKFRATTFLEYFLRAEESYSRETVTVHWIRNCISGSDVVLDIGANVGAYSLLIGKKIEHSGGKVYAVEPEAGNFHSLNVNICLNNLSGTVFPYCFAIGDKRRVSEFFLSSLEVGSSMHSIDQPVSGNENFKSKHIQGVLVESLDTFLEEPGISFPNHIKIDVDGSEKMIVENMRKTLEDSRCRSIMIEVETSLSEGQIEQTLEAFGFKETMRERMGGRENFNILFERV